MPRFFTRQQSVETTMTYFMSVWTLRRLLPNCGNQGYKEGNILGNSRQKELGGKPEKNTK